MAVIRLFIACVFVAVTILATFTPVRFPFVLPFIPPLPDVEVTVSGFGLIWGTYVTNLQLVSVIATAFLLGPRLGLLTQIIYLTLGFTGLPIFYLGGGLLYLTQPSVGYLISFIPVLLITGSMIYPKGKMKSSRCTNINWLLIAGIVGIMTAHLIGSVTALIIIHARWWEILLAYIILPLPFYLTAITAISVAALLINYVRLNFIKLFSKKPRGYFSNNEKKILKHTLVHGMQGNG